MLRKFLLVSSDQLGNDAAMNLTDAISLAQTGHSQMQATHTPDAPERVKVKAKAKAAPETLWRDNEQPFHSADRMIRDCRSALEDPASWLTHGYTAALHLQWLLQKMKLVAEPTHLS